MADLTQFMNKHQYKAIANWGTSEEGKALVDILNRIQNIIDTMPKTYETDGQGDEAIAYLHYFTGGFDWYITEKDVSGEQIQTFGLAKMQFTELGYINIKELLENDVELDFYFEPTRIGDFR